MNRVEKAGKILGIGLCLLFILFPSIPDIYQWIIFAIILFLVGIPHGGIDHLIHNPNIERNELYRFIINYIILILIYAIVWWLFPKIALLSFIVMSSYHFGQSHFIQRIIPKKFTSLSISLRGLFFLFVILLGSWESTKTILSPIVNLELDTGYRIGILFFLTLVSIGFQGGQGMKLTSEDLFEYFILSPILYFSPLFISFIVYFGFWHALPSMLEEYRVLRTFPTYNSVKKFVVQLLPFSLVSLFGIAFILFFALSYLDQNEVSMLFFALVSLISFPHILYMDAFLKKNYQY
ncbi:MAG: Brp/Blh family beta-carotene 15,15'-dioxygenase [Algoriphagus sp.]|jgi:Brp/Blh family beta-carotene 15,15'-monooxygenase|nr:Brp/Blh family beta-carotene 15,15'-dioxygenase [Algoriphagus sp.]